MSEGQVVFAILGLLGFIGFLVANALFVSAEFAFVSIRRSEAEQFAGSANPFNRAISISMRHLDSSIAAAQVGITMASLAIGWFAEPTLAQFFEPLFGFLPEGVQGISSHGVAAVIAYVLATYLHVVLGEQVPKWIALGNPVAVARVVALPNLIFGWLLYPLMWGINSSGNGVLRLLGMSAERRSDIAGVSSDELGRLLSVSAQMGELDAFDSRIARRAVVFSETSANEIMTSRSDIVTVPAEAGTRELSRLTSQHPYSRFPVAESGGRITGVLHVKDIVRALAANTEPTAIELASETVVLPETVHIDDVFRTLVRERAHMAVLVDEFGDTAGVVTMEDIVEEIFGESPSEFGRAAPEIRQIGPGVYRSSGQIALADLNERFGLDLQADAVNTLGGFVHDRLGRIARAGDQVIEGRAAIRVDRMDAQRVGRVTLRISRRGDEAEDAPAAS